MVNYRTIKIDLDVHKLIETERLSFSEAPNDVLRRLLGLSTRTTASLPAWKPPRITRKDAACRSRSGR